MHFFLCLTIFFYLCQDIAVWVGGKSNRLKKMVGWSASECSGSWVVLCLGASNKWSTACVYLVLFNFFISDLEVTECILINFADGTKSWGSVDTLADRKSKNSVSSFEPSGKGKTLIKWSMLSRGPQAGQGLVH